MKSLLVNGSGGVLDVDALADAAAAAAAALFVPSALYKLFRYDE